MPTLTLLLTAGALARTDHVSLPLVIAAAAGAVVVGGLLAHRSGKLLGERLRAGSVRRCIPEAAWQRAESLMTHHGGGAVLMARFVPVLRTLAPHFAGAARLPYRRIAPYSVSAACPWATAKAGVGYLAATSLQRILTLGGPAVTCWYCRPTGRPRTAPASAEQTRPASNKFLTGEAHRTERVAVGMPPFRSKTPSSRPS